MGEIASAVLILPTDLGRLSVLESAVSDLLGRGPDLIEPEIVRYNLWLAIHELCVNIIQHAYEGAHGEFTVRMQLLDAPWRVEVTTHDRGMHRFVRETYRTPDLEDPPINGLGMFLIEQLVDQIEYQWDESGSEWRLVKLLPLAAPAGNATMQSSTAMKG